MITHSRRLVSTKIKVAAVATLATTAALAAGPLQEESGQDLVLGSWELNVEASKFEPGPPPQSQRRTYEETPEGTKVTIATVDASGTSLAAEYTANYDSLEYPITGSASVDAISLKQINANTAEATLRHARKVIGTARRIISDDGKTMTIHYKGIDPRGESVDITAVYDRVEP